MESTPPLKKEPSTSAQKEESTAYLQSLLNKNLRVTTTDNRMFWGAFKCTDPESNIILQHTYEYRHPTPQQISAATAATTSTATAATSAAGESAEKGSGPAKQNQKVKLDMTSRYLGLVVVPGKYIVRIEAEEFASQMRGRQMKVLGVREQGIGGGVGVGAVGVS